MCGRKAWMITDRPIFQANADLIIGKYHADNFDNAMHDGPAGLRLVNMAHGATAKRLMSRDQSPPPTTLRQAY